MKRVVCIMFLVTALVSANVRALTWDPDNDADFKFNMDFESKDVVVPYTTTDTEVSLVGTVTDYNDRYTHDPCYTKWDPNNFWNTANAIRGTYSGDFCRGNDKLWWGRSPNDVSLVLGGGTNYDMAIFDFGTDDQKRTYAFWFNDVSISEETTNVVGRRNN